VSNEHLTPVWWPHDSLREAWENGRTEVVSTQPWVAALLYQLIRALDVRRVVELGCYKGITSVWLAHAIAANGGGALRLVDTNAGFLEEAAQRVTNTGPLDVAVFSTHQPSMEFLIDGITADVQFVFLDDDKADVSKKIEVLRKRCPGATLTIHDAETVPELAPYLILPTPPSVGSGHLAVVRL